MIAPASRSITRPVQDPGQSEDARGVPSQPTPPSTPGRAFVSRRAVIDLVRNATLGSYGVTGFAGSTWWERLGEIVGLPPRGIAIQLGDEIAIDLDLTVAHGLPIAEVARQVDSAVRYAIRRALDREVARLTIHVEGLRAGPLAAVPEPARDAGDGTSRPVGPDDLAGSGSDVA